jgi:trimeric autotransporter adhesin
MKRLLLLTILTVGCGYGSHYNAMTSGGSGMGSPNIQTLMPNSMASGGSGFMLTVNGGGFIASSVVYWNASPRPTTFMTANQLTAQISATDIANPATVGVYIRTTGGAYGMGVNSNTMNFTVN